MRGVQANDGAMVTNVERKINIPVLSIGGTKDLITRADELRPKIEPWTTKRIYREGGICWTLDDA